MTYHDRPLALVLALHHTHAASRNMEIFAVHKRKRYHTVLMLALHVTMLTLTGGVVVLSQFL